MDQLSQVKYLENVRGGFRPLYKQKGAKLHCARCQAWGHVKDVCHLPPKCMKCALGHYSWECTVIMKDSPRELMRCINCGDAGHPANYTGCVKAVEYIRALEAKQVAQASRGQQQIRKLETAASGRNRFVNVPTKSAAAATAATSSSARKAGDIPGRHYAASSEDPPGE